MYTLVKKPSPVAGEGYSTAVPAVILIADATL